MKKLKLFLENFLIYGIGGIVNKIIPFIMVPIVTRLMPDTTYYGISDMANTIVSFANAFAIIGMYDAMYRMFFEKEEEAYKKNICSTALAVTVCTSIIVSIVLVLGRDFLAEAFLGDRSYAYLIYIAAFSTLVGATNSIIAAPTRMQNRRRVYLITNLLSSLLAYTIAILLLLKGYYVIALPLAMLISAAVMEILFGKLNHKWFEIKRIKRKYLIPLLSIAIPLLPNFLIYWVFNSCDKLMITNLMGMSATGIYSVGSKLGQASQLIYTAFAGGWQYFAFSMMKEENQVHTNSKVFEYLGILSFTVTMQVCAWSRPIYEILFPKEYTKGYIIAPYLFLAPLLLMLYQVAGNQFLVIKKTWPNMFILCVGAVFNIFLNLWLIPVLGIEGAAIATLAGYAASDILCMAVLCRMKLMEFSRKFLIASIVMAGYFVAWRTVFLRSVFLCTIMAMGITVFYLFLYSKDINGLIKVAKGQEENK